MFIVEKLDRSAFKKTKEKRISKYRACPSIIGTFTLICKLIKELRAHNRK